MSGMSLKWKNGCFWLPEGLEARDLFFSVTTFGKGEAIKQKEPEIISEVFSNRLAYSFVCCVCSEIFVLLKSTIRDHLTEKQMERPDAVTNRETNFCPNMLHLGNAIIGPNNIVLGSSSSVVFAIMWQHFLIFTLDKHIWHLKNNGFWKPAGGHFSLARPSFYDLGVRIIV